MPTGERLCPSDLSESEASSRLFEINHDTVFHGDDDVFTLKNITTTDNNYVRGQVVEYAGSAVGSAGWGTALSTVNASIYGENNANGNPGLLFSEGYRE